MNKNRKFFTPILRCPTIYLQMNQLLAEPDDRCFLAAWVVSTSVTAFKHGGPNPNLSKQKDIYPPRCSAMVCYSANVLSDRGNVWKKCSF